MFPNPISIPWPLVILFLALCGFVTLLFIPALFELKRPKDPGPRRITDITIRGMMTEAGLKQAKPRRPLPESLRRILMDLEGEEIFEPNVDVNGVIVDVGLALDIEA